MCDCTYTRSMTALAAIAQTRKLGDMIRARRTTLGWTQAELAQRSGVAQADISRIENGQLDARWSTIHRLSQALEAPGEPPKRSLANGNHRAAAPTAPTRRWQAKHPTQPIQ